MMRVGTLPIICKTTEMSKLFVRLLLCYILMP